VMHFWRLRYHYELDKKKVHLSNGIDQGFTDCQRYLKYASTETRSQPNKANLAEKNDIEFGKHYLIDYAQTGLKGPTIAVMWDPCTSSWYRGHCQHLTQAAETCVPSDIISYINKLEIDRGDWAFGWNCAEVHCITKAYEKRKEINAENKDLTNCYFIAYSVGNKSGFYGACKTCQKWIPKFGGKYYSPKDKSIAESTLVSDKDKEDKGKGSNNNSTRPKEAPLRIDID
jgi:hypothetical protein